MYVSVYTYEFNFGVASDIFRGVFVFDSVYMEQTCVGRCIKKKKKKKRKKVPSCIKSLRSMWQSELVADGLAFCICCVQTGGFVLLSPGEDRAFLLASRFLSVGATKENICGMQGRETGERRERERKKI